MVATATSVSGYEQQTGQQHRRYHEPVGKSSRSPCQAATNKGSQNLNGPKDRIGKTWQDQKRGRVEAWPA